MKKLYFLDMDGMMAVFPDKDGEAGTKKYRLEQGFFKKLKPYKGIEELNELISLYPENFYILSTSPHEQADTDKIEWLKLYLPAMRIENIYMNRHTQSKADKAKEILNRELTANDILVDDYKKNLEPWELAGGKGIRRKNGKTKSEWQGEQVCRLKTLVKRFQAVA